MMSELPQYRPHKVRREDRQDGTILLTSGYEMSTPVETSSDWLHHWAETRPDTVFLAERSGEGWREVPYAEALQQVQALASGLLARGLNADTPILILSGNGVDHGLLTLAAHYVGIPTVPVAEQYSLIPGAQAQLQYIMGLVRPRMVFAEDGARFATALALDEMTGLDIIVSRNATSGQTLLSQMMSETRDVAAARAKVGPDSVVKILMTSGSTSNPKGVLTTHRMMCANQAQVLDAMPYLSERVHRIVDWLPWNHVFGGSHNFNMMLANGGSLYVDGGKPAKPLIGATLENNRMISATLAFNVPVGFAMLRDVMKSDAALRDSYFRNLDMLFYAGASLPQDVWQDLADMAMEVRGAVPLMTSSWGLTETGPACMVQHEPTDRSGIVGVPMTGVTLKLVPDEGERFEMRVKGDNIMTGYLNDPGKTAEAFDEEGFFKTGDAMAFVDPEDMTKGMRFDGRMSEEFKLSSGIWVRATELRLQMLVALAGVAADVVITGAGRDQVGMLILPSPDLAAQEALKPDGGALLAGSHGARIKEALARQNETASGSSNRITRALILSEPPSMAEGEITAKGNLNFRKLLTRRADVLERLYNDTDPAVIRP